MEGRVDLTPLPSPGLGPHRAGPGTNDAVRDGDGRWRQAREVVLEGVLRTLKGRTYRGCATPSGVGRASTDDGSTPAIESLGFDFLFPLHHLLSDFTSSFSRMKI